MQRFSLQFHGQKIEQEYKKMIYKITAKIIKRNFSILSFICLVLTIKNAIQQQNFSPFIIVPLILSISFGMVGILVEKFPKLLDYVLFLFQIALNIFWLVCQILNLHQGYFRLVDSYCLGYIIAYLSQCYNVGSNTILKLITISLNIGQICVVVSLHEKQLSFNSILILFSGAMCMYHIHSDDRCRREAYLIWSQQELWEQNLDHVSEISIVQCTFDKKNETLKLHKANKISKIKFFIHNQISFKDFSRNLIISLPQDDNARKKQKVTLEQVLFQMYTNPEEQTTQQDTSQNRNRSKSSLSNIQTSGVFQQNNYKVQIFSFWREEQVAVIQISKLEDTLDLKTTKFKLQICQIALRSYQQQLKKIIIPTMSLLKNLNDLHKKRGQLTLKIKQSYNKLFNLVEYNLYQSFRQDMNIQLFFQPKIDLCYQSFEIDQVISKAIQTLSHKIQQKNFEIITEQAPIKIQITSNCQMFHQVILNILDQIIHSGSDSEKVYILYQPKKQQISKTSYNDFIQFTFLTKSVNAPDLLKDQIWSLNPMTSKDYRTANLQKNHLNINLCVAHNIVGLLGPKNKIKYLQSDSMCRISFRVYTDLQCVKSKLMQRGQIYNDMESMNNFNTGLLSPSRISTPSKMLIPKQIKFEIGSKD